jgi:hypothetical protein
MTDLGGLGTLSIPDVTTGSGVTIAGQGSVTATGQAGLPVPGYARAGTPEPPGYARGGTPEPPGYAVSPGMPPAIPLP